MSGDERRPVVGPPGGPPGAGEPPHDPADEALLAVARAATTPAPEATSPALQLAAGVTSPTAAERARLDVWMQARLGAGVRGLPPQPRRAPPGPRRAAALVALAAALLFGLLRGSEAPLPPVSEGFAVREERALGAGVFVAGDAQILVREREATRVLVEVVEGEARFHAADPRALRVIAGDVRVEAAAEPAGSSRSPAEEPLDWTVRRRGATVEVEVGRGRAALHVGEREVALAPGQRWSRVLPWFAAAEPGVPRRPREAAETPLPPAGGAVPPVPGAVGQPAVHPGPAGEAPEALGVPVAPGPALAGELSTAGAPRPEATAGAAPAAPEQAAAAFTALLQRREAGAPADELLRDVDRFRARWPRSALDGEAELLRLEALGDVLPVAQATGALDAWLDTHPQDPRRAVVLFVAARVAAERAGDCGAAARYLRLVEAEGSPAEAERARRERRSCGR